MELIVTCYDATTLARFAAVARDDGAGGRASVVSRVTGLTVAPGSAIVYVPEDASDEDITLLRRGGHDVRSGSPAEARVAASALVESTPGAAAGTATITTNHPASRDGLPVVLDATGAYVAPGSARIVLGADASDELIATLRAAGYDVSIGVTGGSAQKSPPEIGFGDHE